MSAFVKEANCPICSKLSMESFLRDKLRSYHLCESCRLIFVSRVELISPSLEFVRYQSHQNNNDQKYLSYLEAIAQACLMYLKPQMKGLDFGCGATTILGDLFTQSDCPTLSYDLFFHPDDHVLAREYDFIILCEVIEHLRSPREVLEQLRKLLVPGGKVFIKTCFYGELEGFSKWYYKGDITHIQFFNLDSLNYLAEKINLSPSIGIGKDLYLIEDRSKIS